MTVKLQACETGLGNFGQNLSIALNTPVQAPSGDWVGDNHNHFNNPFTKAPDPNYDYTTFNPPPLNTGSNVNAIPSGASNAPSVTY